MLVKQKTVNFYSLWVFCHEPLTNIADANIQSIMDMSEGAWSGIDVHGTVTLTMARYHLSHFDTHLVMFAPFVHEQGEIIQSRKKVTQVVTQTLDRMRG